MAESKPEKISGPSHIDPTKAIQSEEQEQPKPSQSFDSFMKQGDPKSLDAKTEGPSPLDLASQGKSTISTTGPTHESIAEQMKSTSSVLGDLQNQMTNKNLNLRQSQKYLLRNKLTNSNKNIRTAAQKTGVDTGPPVSQFNRENPVNKFLGLLADSQNQLSHAQSKIKGLNANGLSVSPGDLLMVQIKLAKAQQELEYSSVLLSTAVSGIKTLFNIQL